jgi:hypothetical protein
MEFKSMDLNNLVSLCTQKYNEKTLLEADIKKMVPVIMEKMQEADVDRVLSPFGKYSQSFSVKYTYSPETQELANQLVMAQEREKSEGVAQKIETPNIKFGKLTKDEQEF